VAGLLELNHNVLCGRNPDHRREHEKHIQATAQQLYTQVEFNINDVLRWHRDHAPESSWRRAAGVYVRILSQPQLYIESRRAKSRRSLSHPVVAKALPYGVSIV
jgi:hypothetical protein